MRNLDLRFITKVLHRPRTIKVFLFALITHYGREVIRKMRMKWVHFNDCRAESRTETFAERPSTSFVLDPKDTSMDLPKRRRSFFHRSIQDSRIEYNNVLKRANKRTRKRSNFSWISSVCLTRIVVWLHVLRVCMRINFERVGCLENGELCSQSLPWPHEQTIP